MQTSSNGSVKARGHGVAQDGAGLELLLGSVALACFPISSHISESGKVEPPRALVLHRSAE